MSKHATRPKTESQAATEAAPPLELERTVALVGLMGAGKSSVGKRLAQRLGVEFIDADYEIERAAGCSIPTIFECYGEAAFRDGERRVIARLLENSPHILATGGGAFMNPETRKRLLDQATVVWLDCDIATLVERVSRKDTRPLLREKDPKEVLSKLAEERNPFYAEAHIRIASRNGPHDQVVDDIIEALKSRQRGADPS